jgi:hypothetical protein
MEGDGGEWDENETIMTWSGRTHGRGFCAMAGSECALIRPIRRGHSFARFQDMVLCRAHLRHVRSSHADVLAFDDWRNIGRMAGMATSGTHLNVKRCG